MKYYQLTRKWKTIKKHLDNDEVQEVLVRDFNKYTYGRWGKEFKNGMLPCEFESCDWDCGLRGRRPEYHNYVKHAACHWLVNFNLKLAMLVEPTKKWRIVTSQEHSTVFDGKETLFDFNFTALKIDPNEAYMLANKKHIKIGSQLKVYNAPNNIYL